MQGQEFPIDDTGQGVDIEGIHEEVIDFLVVLIEAWMKFLLHSSRKLKNIVICLHSWFPLSKKTASGWASCNETKFNLQTIQKNEDFNGERASVHEIAQEKVFGLFRRTTNVQNFDKIVKLPALQNLYP